MLSKTFHIQYWMCLIISTEQMHKKYWNILYKLTVLLLKMCSFYAASYLGVERTRTDSTERKGSKSPKNQSSDQEKKISAKTVTQAFLKHKRTVLSLLIHREARHSRVWVVSLIQRSSLVRSKGQIMSMLPIAISHLKPLIDKPLISAMVQ